MEKLVVLSIFAAFICAINSTLLTVSNDAQLKAAISSTKPSVFFFYSDTCGRSRYMKV